MGDIKMAKLKTLLEDVFQERPKVNKHEVIEGVRNYQKLGGSIYKSGGIFKVDNSDGVKVEMIISDIQSYLY